MPALAFLAVVGLVLVALLFVADATLEHGSPPIVTSDRVGLPEPWHPDAIQTLTTTPAPAPDMTSQPVLSAQPKPGPDLAKIDSAARAARAEAPPKGSSRSTTNRTTSNTTTWSTDFLSRVNRAKPCLCRTRRYLNPVARTLCPLWVKSEHVQCTRRCPLCAKSRHVLLELWLPRLR